MRRGLEGLMWLLLLASSPAAQAGQQVGENSAYAREMGFETRFYFVAGGSDGEGQIEYICKAFPGTFASSSTANAVWQIQRFYYDSSDRLNRISFAGDDDGYTQICDNRSSADFD